MDESWTTGCDGVARQLRWAQFIEITSKEFVRYTARCH